MSGRGHRGHPRGRGGPPRGGPSRGNLKRPSNFRGGPSVMRKIFEKDDKL